MAKGKCEVKIADRFEDRIEEKSVGFLGMGSHFGEISMVFQCKRTASVVASNYITCASISRPKFYELNSVYPIINTLMRKQVEKYSDPLKCFMEMNLNNMDFFKSLPKLVKNDFIFSMKQCSFDKGEFIYRNEECSTEMFLIQSGCVEIQQKQDKGVLFVIEKLFRGSIINHNSFLMNDDMDTDAYCKTNVHCYSMSLDTLKFLRNKYDILDNELDKHERKLVDVNKREPAIDYII